MRTRLYSSLFLLLSVFVFVLVADAEPVEAARLNCTTAKANLGG